MGRENHRDIPGAARAGEVNQRGASGFDSDEFFVDNVPAGAVGKGPARDRRMSEGVGFIHGDQKPLVGEFFMNGRNFFAFHKRSIAPLK